MSRTGAEVQLPHPGKLFIEHLLYLIDMLPVILLPAAQGFIIMKAQIFHIQRVKIVLLTGSRAFPAGLVQHRPEKCIFIQGSPGYSFSPLIKWRRNRPPGFNTLFTQSVKSW